MRRILLALLIAVTTISYGQKPSVIGFSANLVDFSTSLPKNDKFDPGFSLMYWKGITKKIDFSIRYNGLFTDYSRNTDQTSLGYSNEFEASLHARPINDDHFFSPFISAGIGIGNYGNRWATYTPLGGGLQFNLLGEGYIFLQANYRVSLNTTNLDNNMFYSLGLTQTIGSPKAAKPVVKELPPPPVIVVKDRDNDGVPDSLDLCPDMAGLPQFNGCPDTDGDGIPDKDDKCPDQKGVAKYNGCPIPDSDGDGINDEQDKCPDIAGTAKYNGCPLVKEEVKKRAEYAAQHLYFVSASFKL